MPNEAVKRAFFFTSADFFIYLVPGVTFLSAAAFCEMSMEGSGSNCAAAATLHAPLYHAVRWATCGSQTPSPVFSTAIVLIALGAAYVVGHLVSSVSSLFIDRIIVHKGQGYPHSYLLTPVDSRPVRTAKQAFWRGFFAWSNGLLLLAYAFCARWPWDAPTGRRLISTGLVACAGAILAAVVAKWSADCRKDEDRGRPIAQLSRFKRKLAILWALPYDTAAKLFAEFTHSHQPLPPQLADRFKKAFSDVTKLDFVSADSERHWLAYISVMEKSPILAAKVENWMYLYQFSRNLSAAFFLAAVYCGLSLALQIDFIQPRRAVTRWLPPAYAAAACVMLVRYYYLYVCYYSKFLFRCFAWLHESEEVLGRVRLTE